MTHRTPALFAALVRHGRTQPSTAHAALEHDLATFDTKADLAELAAILDRHDDADAAVVRDLVNWSRAA